MAFAADGTYLISVPDEKTALYFGFVGHIAKYVKVGSKKFINVQLSPITSELDEVVVTGYATERKQFDSYANIVVPLPSKNYIVNRQLSSKAARINVINNESENKKNRHNNNVTEREGYDFIKENAFVKATENLLSTCSIDVDAASYSNVRRQLQQGNLPPAGAGRIEEVIEKAAVMQALRLSLIFK